MRLSRSPALPLTARSITRNRQHITFSCTTPQGSKPTPRPCGGEPILSTGQTAHAPPAWQRGNHEGGDDRVKAIRRSPVSRAVAWLLTLALIMPVLLLGPRAAHAQPQATLDVIVADFVNKSGVGGDALARAATDAVVVDLSNSGKFTVFKPQEVLSAAKELGFRVPSQPGQRADFTRTELLKIAKQLGASAVVQGTLEQARYVKGGGAQIGLNVTVLEVASEEFINGGMAIGRARPRPGLDDQDTLLNEAINNASTDVVRQIVQRQIPPATVLNINGDVVILNRGLRDGIKVGDDLIILRDGV